MINRIAFFNRLKTQRLYTSINQGHVQGFDAIINEWEANDKLSDLRWLAYIMATIYHEVNKTMQPIEEYGKGKSMPYGKKLKMGEGPNKRVPYEKPDKLYFGRGLVQTTWYENYEKLTKTPRAKAEGWDFLNKPELMLQMKPSVWSAFYGMTTGLFTGRKLSHYFDGEKEDPLNARKIINGTDKASLIAVYYKKFLAALVY